MVEIKIDNTGNGTCWLYGETEGWKQYVTEDFNEKVVLTGNRHFTEIEYASWYNRVWDILNDYYCYEEFEDNLTEEQKTEIKRLYDGCSCTDEIFMDVLKVLYPDETFISGTIRGYNQGDWQNYIAKDEVDPETLENFYFGKLADITIEKDGEYDFSDVITHDELWKAENNENLKEYLRERYELSDDEELRILQADGYIQVLDWKEVC